MSYHFQRTFVITDAFKQIWNTSFLSDVDFVFNDGIILHAHRLLLCLRSVKMYNEMHDNRSHTIKIEIEKYTSKTMIQFVKYLYTDDCDITNENVAELIEIAKDYQVESLDSYCQKFISSNLNPWQLLQLSLKSGYDDIKNEAIRGIAKNFTSSLMHPSFLEIDLLTLKTVLTFEAVSNPDEFEFFKCIMKWAEINCRKKLNCDNVTSRVKRKFLGIENLKLIRFPAMKNEEFAKCIMMEPELLTHQECVSIFMNISSGLKNSLGFSDKKRCLINATGEIDISKSSSATSYKSTINNEVSNEIRDNISSVTLTKNTKEVIANKATLPSKSKVNDKSIFTSDNNHELIGKNVNPISSNCNNIKNRTKPTDSIQSVCKSNVKNVNLTPSTVFKFTGCLSLAMEHTKPVPVSTKKFEFSFKVSKSIALNGFDFFMPKRILVASLEIDNVDVMVYPNKNRLKTQCIKFEKIILQPHVLYKLHYHFIDNCLQEVLTWKSKSNCIIFKSPIVNDKRSKIEFTFIEQPATYHVGKICFNYNI